MESKQKQPGLYESRFERDDCGTSTVVNVKGIRSYHTVDQALHIVENLEHRAGKGAKGRTGGGVGIVLQISHGFFKKVTGPLGFQIEGEREYGMGMLFFLQNELIRSRAMKVFEIIMHKEGTTFLGWRVVPTAFEIPGKKALDVMPYIAQGFVGKPAGMEVRLDSGRESYIARRVFEQSNEDAYVVSLNSRTIMYKGMFLVGELRLFFSDLQGEDYKSTVTIVHSRFSTNTNPSWMRARPYRFIVHSGEINTIRGSVDEIVAREENMESEHLRRGMHKVLPIINQEGFDSAMLDNALEFIVMSGMDLPLTVMVTIPAPWGNDKYMDNEVKDFYRYYVTMMEPWDGPASILFTDGDVMEAVLDKNGLRSSRYCITEDDYMILASGAGAIDIDQTKVVKKNRLCPGKTLLVGTRQGRFIDDDELKYYYASRNSYGE